MYYILYTDTDGRKTWETRLTNGQTRVLVDHLVNDYGIRPRDILVIDGAGAKVTDYA